MRHYKKGRKLGTDASHTAAIKKNLVCNLFLNDRIKTTLERAKEIRGDVDRIITWAKRGDVHSRRLAIAKLGDKVLVGEIFAKVEQGLFKDRPGGYTRIFKVGKRRGDDATIVLMELVQEPVQFKKKAAAEGEKKSLKVEKRAKAEVLEAVEPAEAEAAEAEEAVEAAEAVVADEAAEAVEAEAVEVEAEPVEAEATEVVESEAPEPAAEPEPEPEPAEPEPEPAAEPEPEPAATAEPAADDEPGA